MPDPVHWSADLRRTAAEIRCDACRVCRWADRLFGRCVYNGPFVLHNAEPRLPD